MNWNKKLYSPAVRLSAFPYARTFVRWLESCLGCHLIQWRTTKHGHWDAVNRTVRKASDCQPLQICAASKACKGCRYHPARAPDQTLTATSGCNVIQNNFPWGVSMFSYSYVKKRICCWLCELPFNRLFVLSFFSLSCRCCWRWVGVVCTLFCLFVAFPAAYIFCCLGVIAVIRSWRIPAA